MLAALLLAAALPVVALTHTWDRALARLMLQLWLLAVCGVYYVRQWAGGGQTLPMKTWRMRLVSCDGTRVTTTRALVRYLLALASTFLLGLGFVWALCDRERQFAHDRVAGTRIVMAEDPSRAAEN
jgi:uncharacterized RDD family membrane protein YckC